MPTDSDQLAGLQAQLQQISAQIANLEQRVRALEQRAPGAPATIAAPAPPAAKRDPARRPERTPNPRPLESHLGVTVINRAGAITLAIGIIFFFKYAVDNRWIGAGGRIALGLIAGALLVGVAEWLRKRGEQAFSQGVCGCGIAILYTSFYASSAYYELFPEWLAFCGMVAVCAVSIVLSFRYPSAALAALGIAIAFLAPILIGDALQHPWLLFPYLLALDICALAVALSRKWTMLHALALAGTGILFLVWACGSNAAARTGTGLLFLCVFFVLLFVASIGLEDRRFAYWFVSLNAGWTMASAWLLLNPKHPGWMCIFAAGLAGVHFLAARSQTHVSNLGNLLYTLAHACLLTAALRALDIWAVNHSSPLTRASVVSESSSVFLAIYAIALIAFGIVRRSPLNRIMGLALLGIVIAKLYVYDVWQLTRFYRISAFVALGILLLAASYIYSRFREKLGALWTGAEAMESKGVDSA